MKAGFKIVTCANENSQHFIVSNYDSSNEVYVYGFVSKKQYSGLRSKKDIGVWQPKGTKQQSNK